MKQVEIKQFDLAQNHFQTVFGSTNPDFADATSKDQDIADGYVLGYNPIGILWMIGIGNTQYSDDYNKKYGRYCFSEPVIAAMMV